MGNDEEREDLEKPSEIELLASELVETYIKSRGGKEGKPISLRGGSPEVREPLYGEITRLLVENNCAVPVFLDAHREGAYSIDIGYFQKRLNISAPEAVL